MGIAGGRVAWIFPGQGSQRVGMGKDLAERYPSAARVFEEANDAIGVDLRALCFDGPQDELDKTANTQPALVAASIAAFRAAEEAGGAPLPEPASCSATRSASSARSSRPARSGLPMRCASSAHAAS